MSEDVIWSLSWLGMFALYAVLGKVLEWLGVLW